MRVCIVQQFMAKARAPRRTLDSYTIKSINKTIRGEQNFLEFFSSFAGNFFSFFSFSWEKFLYLTPPRALTPANVRPSRCIAGDCVLMRPSDSSKPSYVAKVEKIESDGRGSVRVHVRWYYRPEESIGGRRQFHGSKEVFLSDHYDVQSADTIEGKCTVHTFKSYTKLDAVGNDDFFCRFEYNSSTGAFNPDRVAVYVSNFLVFLSICGSINMILYMYILYQIYTC